MSAPPNGLLFGLYRALVIDSNDPKQTGRVKVRIPDIMTNKATCGEFCEKVYGLDQEIFNLVEEMLEIHLDQDVSLQMHCIKVNV